MTQHKQVVVVGSELIAINIYIEYKYLTMVQGDCAKYTTYFHGRGTYYFMFLFAYKEE